MAALAFSSIMPFSQTAEERLWNALTPPNSEPIPPPAGMSGVGVCITGMQRSLFDPAMIQTLNDNLIQPLGKVFEGNESVRTFFSIPSSAPERERAELTPRVERHFPGAHLTVLDDRFPSFSCRPDGLPPVDAVTGEQLDGACPALVHAPALNPASSSACDFLHVLVQWRGISACYDAVQAAESARGMSFEWLIRTRSDLVLLDASLAIRLAGLSQANVYVPKYGMSVSSTSMCQNDHIFACPRDLCRPYFRMLELWQSPHCSIAGAGASGRSALDGIFARTNGTSGRLQPSGMRGPPTAPFAVPATPTNANAEWYMLARYSGDGRVCDATCTSAADCCGLMRELTLPYAKLLTTRELQCNWLYHYGRNDTGAYSQLQAAAADKTSPHWTCANVARRHGLSCRGGTYDANVSDIAGVNPQTLCLDETLTDDEDVSPPAAMSSSSELGPASAKEVVRTLNERWLAGAPSDDLSSAGVLMRVLDGDGVGFGHFVAGEPTHYRPLKSAFEVGAWDAGGDRVSSTLVNSRHPDIFRPLAFDHGWGELPGLILKSGEATTKRLLCMGWHDFGSLQYTCSPGQPGCTPGCPARTDYCTHRFNTDADGGARHRGAECAYSDEGRYKASQQSCCSVFDPSELRAAMEMQDLQMPRGPCSPRELCDGNRSASGTHNTNTSQLRFMYNEVVLDRRVDSDAAWNTTELPKLVEAVFFTPYASAKSVDYAKAVHRALTERLGAYQLGGLPLMTYDYLAAREPFQLVDFPDYPTSTTHRA